MRRVALLLLVSLLLWACTGSGSTTTTVPPSTSPPSSTTSTASTTTSPGPEWPEILVTNDDGVFYVDSTGEVTQLVKGRVAFAVDDTRGGLLFQVEWGRSWSEVPGSTEVWWVPRGAGEAQALIVPTPGAGHELTLYDALEDPGGHVQVVYVRSDTPPGYWDWVACTYEGECPEVPTWYSGIHEDLIDRLRLFNLDLRTVTEADAISAFESGLGQVSAGGGLVALMEYSQVSSWCVFIDPASVGPPIEDSQHGRSGTTVKVTGAPDECEPDTDKPCPEACVLSPTGSLLGYSLRSKVVLVDTTSGEQVGEIPSAADVAGFDLREGYALIMSAEAPGVLVQVDGSPGEFTVPVDGRARFVTAPVDIDGPVVPPTPAAIQLRADGMGVVDFGDPVDDVVSDLVDVLGPADDDQTFTSDDTEGGCQIKWWGYPAVRFARFVSWEKPQLLIAFSDCFFSDKEGKIPTPHFNGWVYSGVGEALGAVLTTAEGITVGSSLADLRNAYGSDLWLQTEEEPVAPGWRWSTASGIRGFLDRDRSASGASVETISAGWGFDEV